MALKAMQILRDLLQRTKPFPRLVFVESRFDVSDTRPDNGEISSREPGQRIGLTRRERCGKSFGGTKEAGRQFDNL